MCHQDELIRFSSSKARKLLAMLVNWNGKEVTLSHLAEILNEEERDETAAKQTTHLAWHRLKQTLERYGIEKIVVKNRGTCTINKEAVVYDNCDIVHRVRGASNFFVGEYMPEYSWAEVTLSNLVRGYFEEGES